MLKTTLAAAILAAITATPAAADPFPVTIEAPDGTNVTVNNVTDHGLQARFLIHNAAGDPVVDLYPEILTGESWSYSGFDQCGSTWRVEVGHYFSDPGFTGWMYEIMGSGTFTCGAIAPVERDTEILRPPTDTAECAEDDPCWDCETPGPGPTSTPTVRTDTAVTVAEIPPSPKGIKVRVVTAGGMVAE